MSEEDRKRDDDEDLAAMLNIIDEEERELWATSTTAEEMDVMVDQLLDSLFEGGETGSVDVPESTGQALAPGLVLQA